MKRYRRFWGALLAAVLVVSVIPAAYAADPDEDWGTVIVINKLRQRGHASLRADPGGIQPQELINGGGAPGPGDGVMHRPLYA